MTFDHRHQGAWAALVALLAPLAVASGLILVRSDYASTAAALTMVALITVVSIVGTRAAGWLATASSVLCFDYFLTVPYDRFTISHRSALETTIAVLVVGALVSELAERSRRHWASAREARAELSEVARVAAMISAGAEPGEVIATVEADLGRLLDLRECRFDPESESPPLARVGAGGGVTHVGLAWPTRDVGLPGPRCEIAVTWRGVFAGRFVLTPAPGRPVAPEALAAAVALVDVAAGSIAQRYRVG